MNLLLGVLLVLLPSLASAPLLAQVGPDTAVRDALRLEDAGHRHAADVVSTVLVGVALAMPCLIDRTWGCVKQEGLQVGVSLAAGELVTRLLPRTRPDGRDNRSWFSKHSMLACVATLSMPAKSNAILLCPAVMILRVEADEHYATDTLGGLAAAAVVSATVRWGH